LIELAKLILIQTDDLAVENAVLNGQFSDGFLERGEAQIIQIAGQDLYATARKPACFSSKM
jgi:hypothetical protein